MLTIFSPVVLETGRRDSIFDDDDDDDEDLPAVTYLARPGRAHDHGAELAHLDGTW